MGEDYNSVLHKLRILTSRSSFKNNDYPFFVGMGLVHQDCRNSALMLRSLLVGSLLLIIKQTVSPSLRIREYSHSWTEGKKQQSNTQGISWRLCLIVSTGNMLLLWLIS